MRVIEVEVGRLEVERGVALPGVAVPVGHDVGAGVVDDLGGERLGHPVFELVALRIAPRVERPQLHLGQRARVRLALAVEARSPLLARPHQAHREPRRDREEAYAGPLTRAPAAAEKAAPGIDAAA